MKRREFIGGLLATAAVRMWPFRVFSFPTDIAVPERIIFPKEPLLLTPDWDWGRASICFGYNAGKFVSEVLKKNGVEL